MRDSVDVTARDRLKALFDRERDAGFQNVAGTEASATIPVADRLLTEITASLLPNHGLISNIVLNAMDGNEMDVELRVTKGAISFPVSMRLAIDPGPVTSERPVLSLRLQKVPLLLRAGGAMLSTLDKLPPGISIHGDRIDINVYAILARYDAWALLRYVKELSVSTRPGVVVLDIRTTIPSTRA